MAPVFIVEEDIRPLDLTANVEHLIIKDMGNLSDMNLQHPELIPLLLATEPQLKENEWIEVKGLMSRSNSAEMQKKEGQNDDACICIVERTKNYLMQPGVTTTFLFFLLLVVQNDTPLPLWVEER